MLSSILDSTSKTQDLILPCQLRSTLPNLRSRSNVQFSCKCLLLLLITVFTLWLTILLICSGDIHPNQGPSSIPSSLNSSTSHNYSNNSLRSPNLSHNLSFVHYNVQSILNKLDLLEAELFEFDILAFTETWLNPTVQSDDLVFQTFHKPERKDRRSDHFGGLLLYVKSGIFYKRRSDLEINGIECIWIEVVLNKKSLLFGLFYRPPNSSADVYSNIEESISLAVDTGTSDIIITGDFNFNVLNSQTKKKIDSLCTQFSLHQLLTDPSHFTEHSSSLLDLILVSNKEHLILHGVGDPFLDQQLRYHCPIYGFCKFSKPKAKAFTRHIWMYNNGNFGLLREKASSIDWRALENDDISLYASNLNSTILSLTKECIPNKSIRVRTSDPPWITTLLKRQIRKRKRLYRKAKQTNLERHWIKFRQLRNETNTMIRNSKQQFYDNIAEKLKSKSLSSKDWWSTLKTFISPNLNSAIPPIESEGIIYSDDFEKANLFNNYFQGQTVLDDSNAVLPELPEPSYLTSLSSIAFDPQEVEEILRTLKTDKASGPDGLSNRILKELSHELSSPLCSLFNKSLSLGKFPSPYKDANVTPVHTKGDLSLVSNYRPISLLNSVAKLFEKLVFKYLYNHLQDNNMLSSLQSGFIPGDSTVNQLVYLYHIFTEALDAGKEVRTVFCDISKAFDRVWHEGLIYKLKAAGVSGDVLRWFQSYLSGRRQRVVLPGSLSEWVYIKAGVPQGSILGPLLFLLYINDIVKNIGSNIRLFADDTSLFIIVDNPTTAALCLNSDLEKLSRWAAIWLVTFNPSKNESLLISRKINKPIHPPLYMQNVQIQEVSSHKHLGLYFSNDCSWHQHIDYIKQKAWFRIHIMRKLKFKLDRKSLETIYLTFIRPLLEYGDVIWDNCTQYEKNELDKIQNEAARITTGTTKLVSLDNLYKEVGWQTLHRRRQDHKITLFYKMFNQLTPVYLSFLIPQQVNAISHHNLRNSNDIHTIRSNTSLYHNSFLPSTLRQWNSLPVEVRQLNTLSSFKTFLKKDLQSVPTYYYCGSRKAQILHARLRTGCSSLNMDLFHKNITESPLCRCGSIEDTQHYFVHCRFYQGPRNTLLNACTTYQNPSLSLLLFGSSTLSLEANIAILEHVHKYILDTKRFT